MSGRRNRRERRRQRPLRYVVGELLLILGVGAFVGCTASSPPSKDALYATEERVFQAIGATNARLDAAQRVLEVRGPDPESVLIAYGYYADLEVTELRLADPPGAGSRLGVLAAPAGPSRFEVDIRRVNAAEWIVGGDDHEIRPRRAKERFSSTSISVVE